MQNQLGTGAGTTKMYSSTAFSPLPTSPGTLNFWVGHVPNPARGNWRILRDYLLDVVSDGNQDVYEYLVKYMACPETEEVELQTSNLHSYD